MAFRKEVFFKTPLKADETTCCVNNSKPLPREDRLLIILRHITDK